MSIFGKTSDEGVEQDVKNTEGSSASEDQENNPVPVENRLAELARKQGKADKTLTTMQDSISKLTETLSAFLQNNQAYAEPKQETEQYSGYIDEDVSRYTDARVNSVKSEVQQLKEELSAREYRQQLNEAIDMYPELDKNSDSYDPDFYQMVDQNFRIFSQAGSQEAVKDAVALAATKLGKFEQLERERILADEMRRSRRLADGVSAPRDKDQKGDGIPDAAKTLAGLFPSTRQLSANQLKKKLEGKE